MKHIKQPKKSGLCLVACAAMITGKELMWVHQRATLSRQDGVFYLKEVNFYRYLLTRGYYIGTIFNWKPGVSARSVIEDNKIRTDLDLTSVNLLIITGSENLPNATHSVIWDSERQKVLDPLEDKPTDIYGYELLEIHPIVKISEEVKSKKKWDLL